MKKKNKSFGGAVAAGSALAGAALGAAAVVLSDKKNQEKIKKTIDDLSHEAVIMGKNLKKKAEEFRKSTPKKSPAKHVKVVKTARSASSGQAKPAVKKASRKVPVKKASPKKPTTK